MPRVRLGAGALGLPVALLLACSAPETGEGPCPGGRPCAIMPLGDSITVGYGEPPPRGGYRIPLFRLARAEGRAITFVGSAESGPATLDQQPFPRANEGHSGFGIGEGPTGLTSWLAEHDLLARYRPDIVTLMIGTNDITDEIQANAAHSDAPARLSRLVDGILASDPRLLLVVAQIVPRADGNDRVRAYNAAVADLVATRAAAGRRIVLVDLFAAFVANPDFASAYLSDGLHPSGPGYQIIGRELYRVLQPYLR
jgi:lysophospholipase L1-like esterase